MNNVEKRFHRVDELPEWAKEMVQRLEKEGKIADGNQLDVSMDMLRVLVIMSR